MDDRARYYRARLILQSAGVDRSPLARVPFETAPVARGAYRRVMSASPVSFRRLAFTVVVSFLTVSAIAQPKAQSSTANLSINASVKANCTISTAPIAFGSYDPIGANASAALDATGSITVSCTKGSTVSIGLGAGQNALVGARRMSAAAEFLTYEIFLDTTRLTVWANTGAAMLSTGTAPSKSPRAFVVYGRVAAGQDVSPGTFSDVVVATVNF